MAETWIPNFQSLTDAELGAMARTSSDFAGAAAYVLQLRREIGCLAGCAEPGDQMPTVITPRAWKTAMVIDEEVRKFMAEYGFIRVEGRSKMTEVVSKMVQLAINQSVEALFAVAVNETETETRN